MKIEKNETEQLKNVYNIVKTKITNSNQELANIKGSLSNIRMKLIELYVQEELMLKHNIKSAELEEIRNGIFELDSRYDKLFNEYSKLSNESEIEAKKIGKEF